MEDKWEKKIKKILENFFFDSSNECIYRASEDNFSSHRLAVTKTNGQYSLRKIINSTTGGQMPSKRHWEGRYLRYCPYYKCHCLQNPRLPILGLMMGGFLRIFKCNLIIFDWALNTFISGPNLPSNLSFVKTYTWYDLIWEWCDVWQWDPCCCWA